MTHILSSFLFLFEYSTVYSTCMGWSSWTIIQYVHRLVRILQYSTYALGYSSKGFHYNTVTTNTRIECDVFHWHPIVAGSIFLCVAVVVFTTANVSTINDKQLHYLYAVAYPIRNGTVAMQERDTLSSSVPCCLSTFSTHIKYIKDVLHCAQVRTQIGERKKRKKTRIQNRNYFFSIHTNKQVHPKIQRVVPFLFIYLLLLLLLLLHS